MRKLTLALTILFITSFSFSQSTQKQRLKVFVDCNSTYCDLSFIKTEINIVDFVLDRIASDVHVLFTSQQLGSGARQYQMIFFGQNNYKQAVDTLVCNTKPNATEAEIRDLQIQYLKIGLMPFITRQGFATEVTLNMKQNISDSTKKIKSNQNTKDKWNYWVYRINANGNLSADQNYKSNRINLNINANRITDKLKLNFRVNTNRNNSTFTYDDGNGNIDKIKVNNSGWNINHKLVKSINKHWSIGYDAYAFNSVYSNIKSSKVAGPVIEYSVFPYKDVNTKFFTFQYGINYRHNNYYDTTLYLKTKEALMYNYVSTNLSFNQKWGTFNTGINYIQYFHDSKVNNLDVFISADVRVTGGLSFYMYASGGLVHDQLYLPKGDASINDLLARRRQLASDFNFFTSFGISYRFGSILNNFVNPRIESFNGNF
jgi:hypothetical protein